MSLTTSLNFFGQTEAAVEFYRDNLDAEVLVMMRFSECPNPQLVSPEFPDKIFHATFRIGGTEVMASDVGCHDPKNAARFIGFALGLRVDSPETAEKYFVALAESGTVQMPMTETFFARRYGIVSDSFGITWKIIAANEDVSQ
jgi:PhnB protein